MSLARHIRQRDWSGLETAWTEWILGEAAIDPALEALEVASRSKEIARCLPFVKEHAEMLVGNERAEEAAHLVGSAMVLGGSPGELAPLLLQATTGAWSEHPQWESFQEVAGFHDGQQDLRGAWKRMVKLLALEKGRVVYHAKGWGLGTIEDIVAPDSEVVVRFQSGKRDQFPLASAVDIFEVLEPTDLRTLVVSDPDGLKKRLKDEPLEILRWVCRRNQGKVNHAGLKLALGMLGVEGAKFTAWWRKARKAAETSEWFELSGPATRVQVRMLDTAADPAEGLKRQLKRATGLDQALVRVKALLGGGAKLDEKVREAALSTLEELASDVDHPLEYRLAVWLFLREELGRTPEDFTTTIEYVVNKPDDDPSGIPPLWRMFRRVPGQREQERCVEVLREVRGEGWLDEANEHMVHAPTGMVRALVDALESAGRHDELVSHYASLLARPTRNPGLLVRLAERVEGGKLPGTIARPLQRAQCLLQLAVHLERTAPGNPGLGRARLRLSELLSKGKPPLLEKLLEEATLDDFRSLNSLLESGVDRPVDRIFTQVAVNFSSDVFRGEERPFWEGNSIWTTKAGLAEREEELRVLRDVKIPENAEAIGKAASYGDLSENSEWEAAIEEQRNLTTRAMEIELEVQAAQLIENAAIPSGVAAPGTQVRYKELPAGSENEIRILGPWDADGEKIVSYRSPLAQGLLGQRPGQTAKVQLPTGEVEVQVVAVEPLSF